MSEQIFDLSPGPPVYRLRGLCCLGFSNSTFTKKHGSKLCIKKSQQKKNDRLPSLSSSVTKREPKAALSPIFCWIVKNPHFTV